MNPNRGRQHRLRIGIAVAITATATVGVIQAATAAGIPTGPGPVIFPAPVSTAGYVAVATTPSQRKYGISTAALSIRVPSVTCAPDAAPFHAVVGASGFASAASGRRQWTIGLYLRCAGGVATYRAGFGLRGGSPALTVSPGDLVHVKEVAGSELFATDVTTHEGSGIAIDYIPGGQPVTKAVRFGVRASGKLSAPVRIALSRLAIGGKSLDTVTHRQYVTTPPGAPSARVSPLDDLGRDGLITLGA